MTTISSKEKQFQLRLFSLRNDADDALQYAEAALFAYEEDEEDHNKATCEEKLFELDKVLDRLNTTRREMKDES